ncbi:hypothetical protein HFO06_11620 [Rhizobium leguminosarum]|uniref:NAD(P)H-dependent oxidoreductase n=1 Tax=Rhizobium leguminosarum TaxID=384 RepID=UPI001C98C822|nr:NAD(P)H-dependent oxidoreductase [Rhizobium leguminosarum]MBY5763736.1 hypothetical protein [Rhizobium leguminosarum]
MPEASALADLPAASPMHLRQPDMDALRPAFSTHKPRILILYGSLRAVSYSRFLAQEAARLLEYFGCEVRIFNPEGLPLPDAAPASHPKVQELREWSAWSEGQVWVQEFDADGRMKPSSYYDRVVDVCEELVKFTLMTRDASNYLTDRYSERKEEVEKLEQRVSLRSL